MIRIVERRIDQVLDAALLDHESMTEFADVTFEGEWTFLKSLTARGATAKKTAARVVPKARDVFAAAAAAGGAGNPRASVDFEATPSFAAPGSPDPSSSREGGGGGPGRPMSVADFRTPSSWSPSPAAMLATPTSATSASFASSPSSSSAAPLRTPSQDEPASPKSITAFLTSVLAVLQLYDVNPAVTCQAFSQVYYWVGCEVFNRILTRKKYLCRSKAVQIRMNMTILEDWVRDRSVCLLSSLSISLLLLLLALLSLAAGSLTRLLR